MAKMAERREPSAYRQSRSRVVALLPVAAVAGFLTIITGAVALDAVAKRQREMKEIAAAAKTIADMFKTPETYSARMFKIAAEAIVDRADQHLVDDFGTRPTAGGSKANNEIAVNHARFAELAKDLKTYAEVLSAAADKHPDVMPDEMRMKRGEPVGGGPLGTRLRNESQLAGLSAEHAFHLMLQTCTSCHSRFRTE